MRRSEVAFGLAAGLLATFGQGFFCLWQIWVAQSKKNCNSALRMLDPLRAASLAGEGFCQNIAGTTDQFLTAKRLRQGQPLACEVFGFGPNFTIKGEFGQIPCVDGDVLALGKLVSQFQSLVIVTFRLIKLIGFAKGNTQIIENGGDIDSTSEPSHLSSQHRAALSGCWG
ncbi:MAG: hypothetical protein ACI8W8_003403 [Rhodothermales bacterium]|jgi:hypothetical protein